MQNPGRVPGQTAAGTACATPSATPSAQSCHCSALFRVVVGASADKLPMVTATIPRMCSATGPSSTPADNFCNHGAVRCPGVVGDCVQGRFSFRVGERRTLGMAAVFTWEPGRGCGTVATSVLRKGPPDKKKAPGLLTQVLLTFRYFGSSTWARTRDLRINSPALYRLSYRGIFVKPAIITRLSGAFSGRQSNTGVSTPSTLCSFGLVVVYCRWIFFSGKMMGAAPKAASAHS